MIRITDYVLKTAGGEAISASEAKLHLKVDLSTDDTLIAALIQAARENVEAYTGRVLVSSTWYGYADTIDSDGFEITQVPIVSLTSIKYQDGNNAQQTWAATNYILNATRTPSRIGLSSSASVPTTYGGNHDWVVEFVAGYANAAAVPAAIKAAMLLMIGHLYEHREGVIIGAAVSELPLSVKYLLTPYIVWR
jgi:uncharacterized phiE125 gp8 family phage protein